MSIVVVVLKAQRMYAEQRNLASPPSWTAVDTAQTPSWGAVDTSQTPDWTPVSTT